MQALAFTDLTLRSLNNVANQFQDFNDLPDEFESTTVSSKKGDKKLTFQ